MVVSVSTLAQALAQTNRMQDQQFLMTRLATQMATGKIGQDFASLGDGIMTSQRARADLNSIDTYISNIKHADRRMNLMLNTVEEFKAQAENFSSALTTFIQEGSHQEGQNVYDPNNPTVAIGMTSAEPDVDMSTLIDLADNLFDYLSELINTQDEGRYVLGGSDTFNKPLGETSLLDSAVTSLISDWKDGTIDTSEIISAFQNNDSSVDSRALTDNIVGYSSELSAGNVGDVFVRVNDLAEIKYTARANEDSFRDIFVGLALIKSESFPPINDAYIPPNAPPAMPDVNGAPGATKEEMEDNFYELFNSINVMVNKAIDNVDKTRFRIESARSRVAEFELRHEESRNLLLDTVADVENVDITEVALRLNTLQIQIEASYAVTAKNQQLSLVNFLR